MLTGTGPTRSISQRSPFSVHPRGQRGAVDGDPDLDRLAGPFTRESHQGIRRVGGARLAAPGTTGVAEDPVRVRLPGRAEPSAGVGRQACVEAVRPVGIGPLVRLALDMQPASPCPIIGLGAGAHLPAPIPQPLHARIGRGC